MTADQAAALSVGDVQQLMQTNEARVQSAPSQPDPMLNEAETAADALTALVGVTDEGLRTIADAFRGTQRIAGRDGDPGPAGPVGPTGAPGRDSTVLFVDGATFQRRIDDAGSIDGVRSLYIGRALQGTAESDPGWYVERISISPETGLTVEATDLGEASASWSASWTDRADAEYSRAPARTALLRAAFFDPSLPAYLAERNEGQLADQLTSRRDDIRALVEGQAVA